MDNIVQTLFVTLVFAVVLLTALLMYQPSIPVEATEKPVDRPLLSKMDIYTLATKGSVTALVNGRYITFDNLDETRKFLWHE